MKKPKAKYRKAITALNEAAKFFRERQRDARRRGFWIDSQSHGNRAECYEAAVDLLETSD